MKHSRRTPACTLRKAHDGRCNYGIDSWQQPSDKGWSQISLEELGPCHDHAARAAAGPTRPISFGEAASTPTFSRSEREQARKAAEQAHPANAVPGL
ncbi:MAG: hypothetical protein KDF67_03135, partial [Ottowia sp.]|nr:hypothetical protein [Ottowia sp.]